MMRRVSLLVFFLLCAVHGILAQHPQTGIYQFGAFDTPGFDTINRGNLNSHITVPIFGKAGRAGTNFSYALNYDSLIWSPQSSSGANVWSPIANWGWATLSNAEFGYVSYQSSTQSCTSSIPPYKPGYEIVYSNFLYHDAVGRTHPFPMTLYGSCPGTLNPGTGSSTTSDNSGYTLYHDQFNYTVFTKTGEQYAVQAIVSYNGNPSTAPTNSGTYTDTNGNQISVSSAGVYTDTLGTTALTVTGSGTASSPMTYAYTDTTGASRTITENYKNYTIATNFGVSGVSEYSAAGIPLVSSIVYPDGSQYTFTYETTPGSSTSVTGRIASVTLRTGGKISYAYTGGSNGIEPDGSTSGFNRTTSDGTTKYARSGVTSTASATNYTDAASNVSTSSYLQDSLGYLYETLRSNYSGAASGTPLKQTTICYSDTTCPSTSITEPITTQVVTTTQNGTTISDDLLSYSGGFLMADDDGYMETLNSYKPFTGANSIDFARLSGSTISLENGSAFTQVAGTTYGFDQTTLTTTSGIPQHAAVTTARANVTTVSPWLNTTNAPFGVTTVQYYDTGVPQTSATPSGTSSYSYESTQSFLTKVTPPTPSSGVALPVAATSDPVTGLPLTVTDPNNATSTYKTYDEMLRPVEIDLPNGGKQTFNYPSANQVGSFSSIASSVSTNTQTLYDGYGRMIRVAVFNGQGSNSWYQQDYCYDVNGRLKFQSTGYLGTGFGVASVCSGAGDTITYDALGRVAEVVHGDSTHINYTYTGNATETVDEHGVNRINQLDGHGRLSAVCEVSGTPLQGVAPSACGLNIAATGFLTTYAYSAGSTGNQITTVTQGSQTRIFQTDSLGRTVSTQEPEELISTGQGVTRYSYAYSGHNFIVSRTRPKANQESPSTLTTTTTTYDAVGRLIGFSYNDGITPNKAFYYDTPYWTEAGSQANLKGRLSLANTGSGSTEFTGTLYSYDQLGNTTAMWECQPSGCGTSSRDRTLSFGYDLASRLTSETEAVTGTVGFDLSLVGEVNSISSSYYNAANPQNLVSSVTNSVAGPTLYTLGNGLKNVSTYDSLLNISGGYVCNGSSSANCSGGTQLYGYTSPRTAGRVFGSCDTALSICANFGYDGFGRLASRTVSTGTAQNFTYGYDRYGNRWQQTVTSGSGPQPQLSFDSGNHVTNSGTLYDAAGNMLQDGSGNSYIYDADGNVLSVSGNNAATYVYDALNQKVSAATSAETSEFTYDYLGRRLETWNPSTNVAIQVQVYWGTGKPFAYRAQDGSTYFQHADWVGTQRALTNYTGASAGTYQSLPFGDGFSSSGRNDNLTHFSGQNQDIVGGVSQGTYRAMSTTHGRWMSPDPYSGSYDMSNPQSFDRYAYALNNPISLIDPSGLDVYCDSNSVTDPSGIGSTYGYDCVDTGSGGSDGGSSSEGGGAGTAPSKVGCGTVLPNGQTVGSVVRQQRANLQNAFNQSVAQAQTGMPSNPLGYQLGAFTSIALPNGPIDFKKGQTGQTFVQMGLAGNFAYYAIGAGYFSPSTLDAGAGAYGLIAAAFFPNSTVHFSDLTGNFFSDSAAAQMRGPGLAAGGCSVP